MITSAEVLQAQQKIAQNVFTNRKCIEDMQKQRNAEREFIYTQRAVPIKKKLHHLLPSSAISSLKEKEEDLRNLESLQVEEDIYTGAFYHADHTSGRVSRTAALMDWFTKVDRTPHTLQITFRGVKDALSVKEGYSPESNAEIIHALYVAIRGTNRLRAKFPNFAYVYGGFSCPGSTLDKDGKVLSLCGTEKKNVEYIVYENIAHPTLSEEMDSISAYQFYDFYLQAVLTTFSAYEEINWTHYDLHSRNVILRDLPNTRKFRIRYTIQGKTYEVTTTRIATLVDFHYSHFKFDHTSYGACLPESGIFPSVANPFHDVYKLLLFCGLDAHSNENVLRVIRKIFSFFSRESLTDALRDQRKTYYSLPLSVIPTSLRPEEFLAFLTDRKNFGKLTECLHSTDRTIPLLQCDHNNPCKDYKTILHDGMLEEPRDILDFHDLYFYDHDEIKQCDLKHSFQGKYNKEMRLFIDRLQQQEREIQVDMEKLSLPPIHAYTTDQIFSESVFRFFHTIDDTYKKMRYQIEVLNAHVNIAKDVSFIYEDSSVLPMLNTILAKLKEHERDYATFVEEYSSFRKELKSIATSPEGNRHVRANRMYEWYM